MLGRQAAILALLTFTLDACCSQKLVSVPLDDGGVTTVLIDDEPDAGRDAGAKDGGAKDAGPEKDGGGLGGSGTGGNGGSTGSSAGGGGTGGSAGSTTGGVIGGGGTGGSGGYVDAGPTCTQDPDLTGPSWNMSADYDMTVAVNNGGLPGIITFFNDVNTALSTLSAAGLPVPQWATTLFQNLANLQQLFQEINVQSNLAITPNGGPMSYTGTETWQQVSVYQCPPGGGSCSWTNLPSNVGFTSPPPYGITTCSGTATFAQHDLGAAISQLIPAAIDGIVNITSCVNGTCYSSLDAALNAAFDCNQYSGSDYVICQAATGGLEGELTNALNGISFPVGVCTVEGTATIQPGSPLQLVNGVWDGQLSGVPFPGTFSAVE